MVYQVKDRVYPKDLQKGSGVKNGQLPDSVLVDIPNGRLHHLAADAWEAMCDAAFAEKKVVLSPSSAGDSYRSYQRQEDGFRTHYSFDVIPGAPIKRWKNHDWYLRPGFYEAGTPGTSNHGWGLAIDVAGLGASPVNPLSEWVLDNYDRFGFSHEHKDKSDPPHIRYYPGDEVPAEVSGRHRRRRTTRFPKFDPELGVFSVWPVADNKPRLFEGVKREAEGVRDAIRYAQGVLRVKLGYMLDITGTFDDDFRNFVIWFQTANNLDANGEIGAETWAVLDKFAMI